MKYGEIKTLEDLERAQRLVESRIEAKKDDVRLSVMGVRDSFAPVNLMMSGLRAVSEIVPVDRLLLVLIKVLRNKIGKK